MEILPLNQDLIPQAAELFAQNFRELRLRAPALPARMEDPAQAAGYLERLVSSRPGLAALEDGRLAGYLGWYIVDGFRGASRRAAYMPEWAHGALGAGKGRTYRALYRAAAEVWFREGCDTHALTLLAHDETALRTWFWSGFGLTVVDAVRPMRPLGLPVPQGLEVRRAGEGDLDLLAVLETEHWRHYPEPPTLMPPQEPRQAEEFAELVSSPVGSAWLAFAGEEPAGYLTLESSTFGAASSINAEGTIAINAAFVRPGLRGRGAAGAMLESALQEYTRRGYQRCSVDFESLNPEAAAFWPRYFEPVCLSLVRVPEVAPPRR
jgi:GNAT superfamily N-acetyltransferase